MNQNEILLESGTNELEVIEFFLGKESYGVNVTKVLEIIREPRITNLPEIDKRIKGLFEYREEVIPLVDLLEWKRIPFEERGKESKVVVTEFNNMKIGFEVEGVDKIHRLSWEEVEAPDSFTESVSDSSITGIIKIDKKIMFILDLEKIVAELSFGDENLFLNEEVSQKYKVLVAEDSRLIRTQIKESLQAGGFIVEEYGNGKQLWEKINEGLEEVDAVITDIEMPQMDGFTLTRKIKEDENLKNMPVILYSSMITDKIRNKGEEVGADGQISKPEIYELAKKVVEFIEKK